MKNYEHLKILRRFLAERRTGKLVFEGDSGSVQMHLHEGHFLRVPGDNEPVDALLELTSNQNYDTVTEVLGEHEQSMQRAHIIEVVLKACYHSDFTYAAAQPLSRYFYMFPPVRVKLAPMHRVRQIFPGFPDYLKLHKQASLSGQTVLKEYLMKASGVDETLPAVQLITTLYMLGLLAPAPQHTEKANVVGRLMKRIRGL